MSNEIILLIPCAGYGTRFGLDVPKQYVYLQDITILEHTLNKFLEIAKIKKIYIVAQKDDQYIDKYSTISTKINILKVGGDTRAESVFNGLFHINANHDDWIMVHDAVRCCITQNLINKLINELKDDSVGGIVAIPVVDTIKKVSINGDINTIDRTSLYLAQTPQMFRFGLLKQALSYTKGLKHFTDEASSIEELGYKIKLVEGCITNIKLTSVDDLKFIKSLISF